MVKHFFALTPFKSNGMKKNYNMSHKKFKNVSSPHVPSTVIGKLSLNIKGFGFVLPNDSQCGTIFIPSSHINNAIDKDIVEVQIVSKAKEKLDGKILRVVKRDRKYIVGTVIQQLPSGDSIVFSHATEKNRRIILQKNTSSIDHTKIPWNIGDRLSMKIITVTPKHILCSFHKVLGNINNATMDTHVAIEEFHLCSQFPKNVIQEAQALVDLPIQKGERLDLTQAMCITIDPPDAKDFDDALSIEKDSSGNYLLGIHIADVSYFVTPFSFLDKEAYKRANSIYFVDRVIPMLPDILSNHLCSLKEAESRLTASIFITFDQHGNLLKYQIERAIIINKKRLTYEEVQKILDTSQESPFLPTIKLLEELTRKLHKQRKSRGSVDISIPEIRLNLDKDGIPTGLQKTNYDTAHTIVEECMLKANELVAKHLHAKAPKSLFRIHEEPGSSTIQDFFAYARVLGFAVPAYADESYIPHIFAVAQTSPLLEQLAIRFIRSMKLAIYSDKNIGHFGLALEYYTHFTSPIRRYSDLVTHRLLFEPHYQPDLTLISSWCTEQERNSFKAELSVLTLKKLRYLSKFIESAFSVIITNIKSNGIYFTLDCIGLEGFIHVSTLGKEFFLFNEKNSSFTGEITGKIFYIGQTIRVRLTSIDLISKDSAWHLLK